MDLGYVKRIGIAAAYKGGRVLRSYSGRIPSVQKKGSIDLVTDADTDAEKAIIDTIVRVFPDHAILAEESGLKEGGG